MVSAQQNTFIYSVIVAFGGLIFGLDIALISGTLNYISHEFGLSDIELGVVAAAPGVGVLFALIAASYFCDRLGRKKTLIIIAALYLVSAIGSALAPNTWVLLISRFIGGLAFTSLSLSSMYIGEISPANIRGRLVGLNQLNAVIGIALAYTFNFFIQKAVTDSFGNISILGSELQAWRIMLGIEIIPALIWLLLLFYIPESPRWLILRERLSDAINVLHLTTPRKEVNTQLNAILKSLAIAGDHLEIKKQIRSRFSTKMRMALFVGIVVAIVQPVTGANAVIVFTPMILEQVGGGESLAFGQAIWIGIVNVAFTILAVLTLDKIGRRPILLGGLIWASISMGICAFGFGSATYTLPSTVSQQVELSPSDFDKVAPLIDVTYESDVDFKRAISIALGESKAGILEPELIKVSAHLPGALILIGLLNFIAAYAFSVGIGLWILLSEIFPTHLRSVAIPTCAFAASVGGMLVPLLFPWQLANLGAAMTFWLYAIFGFSGFAMLYAFLPETKNKTIEEIESDFLDRW